VAFVIENHRGLFPSVQDVQIPTLTLDADLVVIAAWGWSRFPIVKWAAPDSQGSASPLRMAS